MLMMEMMIMVFFYDNEKTKTHPNDMTLKSKYTNSSDYYLVKRGLTSRQNISTSDFMNLAWVRYLFTATVLQRKKKISIAIMVQRWNGWTPSPKSKHITFITPVFQKIAWKRMKNWARFFQTPVNHPKIVPWTCPGADPCRLARRTHCQLAPGTRYPAAVGGTGTAGSSASRERQSSPL